MLTPHGAGHAAADVLHAYHVGSTIAGKYRVKRLLGHGGMGSVYKAENMAIGRIVAVKVLHPHLADDGVTLTRFQREARAAAAVGHRHVVEVLDMGIEATGSPYIVMEYVRGKSVAKLLRGHGPLPHRRACDVAGQILEALGAVHSNGIVHRDLKPDNVLLTVVGGRADYVKVFDFGVAAFVEGAWDSRHGQDLTPSGRTMGTPYYASPEQLRGDTVRDGRCDLYAVGVLIFEMLTANRPFQAENFADLCRRIIHEPPPPLAAFLRSPPHGLDAVLQRALAKDPAGRFQDADAMLAALVPFGATPPSHDEPEPTDTFTVDLRELRERELELGLGPESEPPPPVTAPGDEVRGEMVIAAREFLNQRLGEARLAELLAAVEPEVHARFVGNIQPGDWYAGGVFDVLELADDRFGDGDRSLVADAGRFFAEHAFSAGVLAASVTPELLFSTMSELWRRYFRHGEAKVAKLGRGYGLLEVGGHPRPRLARSVAVVGYLERAMRRAGARDVDVRLARAAALGDSIDAYEATWSS